MNTEQRQENPRGIRTDVERVAAGYEAWGYRITYEPASEQLPPTIAGYRPDFLAEREGEHIVVEVRREPGVADEERYRELAESVRDIPGWRLDLVVVGSSDTLPLTAGLPVLPARGAERRYEEARQLAEDGHEDAALLIAWSATEAALRLLAERNAVPVQRSNTPRLLKQLVSLGVLGRSQYDVLWSLYQQRNAVAHGFATHQASDSARVIDAGTELLAELNVAA